MGNPPYNFPVMFSKELEKIKSQNLYRKLQNFNEEVTFFSSNDYLGLARHPQIKKAAQNAIEKYGNSATASRLINGNHPLYQELETKIATFKNKEAALVYPTGYMANIGLLSAITGKNDCVFMDKLNHASLYDACQMSKALLYRYTHNDTEQLEGLLKKSKPVVKRLIVTDTVFSMDGDMAPLPALKELADKYEGLLVTDDAHGTGVISNGGEASIEVGTLSKALGGLGGFIAADKITIDYLINKSRPFMFTTGLPPAVLAAGISALDVIKKEPWRREKVLSYAFFVRKRLKGAGFDVLEGVTPIIPIIIGDEAKALEFSDKLLEKGIFIPAIRTPAVEKGRARLRMSVSAAHTEEELEKAIEALIEVMSK